MVMEMRGSLNLSAYYKRPEQPKFYGRALINGKTYDIKGWEKDGPKGKWISLLFEDPEVKGEQDFLSGQEEEKRAPAAGPRSTDWKNDDEPF